MDNFRFREVIKSFKIWRKPVKVRVVALLVCGVVLAGGPASCGNEEEGAIDLKEGPPQRSGGGTDPSWAYTYTSIEDMCAHSDIIVIGTADSVSEIEDNNPSYITYWNISVDSVMKGNNKEKIIVPQMGSPKVPFSDISSCPLFLPGDRYLLFLKQSETGSYYFHPQGHLMVWKDRVYSMNYILPEGKALRPVPGLDCNGVELKNIEEKITRVVDSVHLMFTRYHRRGPFDVMRYEAGMTEEIYVNLFTGNNGPGKVVLRTDKGLLPEGLDLRIDTPEFTVEPYSEYESRILIVIAYDVTPGTYLISVEYDFEGAGSGNRTFTLHINPVGE